MKEEDILHFRYSHGYDSKKYYNLCVCDENTIAWAAGSYVTFYNIETNQRSFRRSTTGGSIGHITKNPSTTYNHIAIAEGKFSDFPPVILIYKWPSMEVTNELHNGTINSFSVMDYSSDGSLLASVGGSPDFNLTIWDWQKSCIKLCTNAYSFDISNVKFSSFITDHLVTSGNNHIKFWRMSQTFTGLKLNGIIGRFGKTDISNILAILSMPDDKVLSGCSWGNILVWDGSVIKIEICRKGRKSCHKKPITQLMLSPNKENIISIGLDGHICTWSWIIVEQAILNANDDYVELNPITEKYIANAGLVHLIQRNDAEWFAQDAFGGVWILDLNIESDNTNSIELDYLHAKKIIHSHGDAIVGVIEVNGYVVTLDQGGSLLLHSLSGQLVPLCIYPDPTSALLYLKPILGITRDILILGFVNGNIKIIDLNIESITDNEISKVTSIEVFKPHNKTIMTININKSTNIMITSSMDSTIFIYNIEIIEDLPKFIPCYFIETLKPVNSLCWKPNHDYIILLSGNENFIIEGELPNIQNISSENELVTYKKDFKDFHKIHINNYTLHIIYESTTENTTYSLKSDIQSTQDIKNSLLVVENDSDIQKNILWAQYDINDFGQVWISQENCNCLLRLDIKSQKINAYIPLFGNTEISITSYIDLDASHKLIGASDGKLLIFDRNMTEIGASSTRDKEKYLKTILKNPSLKALSISKQLVSGLYQLPMHDCHKGKVTDMLLINNDKILITAGSDGNIFSYNLSPVDIVPDDKSFKKIPMNIKGFIQNELEECLTHEEYIQDKVYKLSEHLASNRRLEIEKVLNDLKSKFLKFVEENSKLPPEKRIDFEEDDRIQEYILSDLEDQMKLVHRRLEYTLEVSNLHLHKLMKRNVDPLDVFPFQVNSILNRDANIKIIRQRKLPEDFNVELEEIKNRRKYSTHLNEASLSTQISTESEENENQLNSNTFEPEYRSHLLDDLPVSPPPSRPLSLAIQDYLMRLEKQQSEKQQWQLLLSKNVEFKEDDSKPIIETNVRSSSIGYIVTMDKSERQLLLYNTRKEIFEIQNDFNESLIQLRKMKLHIVYHFNKFKYVLEQISKKIPDEHVKPILLPMPEIDKALEYAEKNLEVKLINLYDSVEDDELKCINVENENDIEILKSEQDKILIRMATLITNFEKSFKILSRNRERVMLQAQYLKLYLLHLLQEQLIIEPYESTENAMKEDILGVEKLISDSKSEISTLKKCIESKRLPIVGLNEQIKQIEEHFQGLVENDQFESFLRRVFKKKAKKSRDHSSSSLSTTSSSSSEDDDDDDDSDVEDIRNSRRFIRYSMDTTTCPPGCDPEIFEKIIQSRTIRQELEGKIKEEENQIKTIRKDIDVKNKHLKILVGRLREKQSHLNALLHEKQTKLHDIKTVVVLSADQCMSDALEELRKGGDALVFPGAGIQDLQDRVKILLKEADEQKRRLSISKQHLKRMNADCTHMTSQIYDLKSKIQHVLFRKLGIVDAMGNGNKFDEAKKRVNEIMDAVLQNMMHQFKMSTSLGMTEEMENQLIYWKKRQYSMEKQYCTVLQEHTGKLETAATLEAEWFSYEIMEKRPVVHGRDEKEYMNELVRLRRIRNEQRKQIEDLKAEVQRLKLKPHVSFALPPITPTNLSASPSFPVSPPSFEFAPNSADSRWIATSLAKELNLVETKLLGSANSSSTLMSTIAELFPVLIEGKLDVNEAAEKIIDTYHSKKGVDDKEFRLSNTYKKSQQSIADILSQITKQNLKLGDADNTPTFDFDDIKNQPGSEIRYIIQELIEAGVSPEDSGAIDIAVAALIEIAPHLIDQKINIKEIVQSFRDKLKVDEEIIEHMAVAVSECLSAQETTPEETSNIAAECLEKLQKSLEYINEGSDTKLE